MKLTIRLIPLIYLIACTSSPRLQEYPERQIDRPYTLLDDTASFQAGASQTMYEGLNDSSTAVNISPVEVALTDNWTLEWAPIPLGARYQIKKTEQTVLGIRFGMGIGYSSFSGVILDPSAGGYYRHIFNRWLAWESSAFYSHELNDGGDDYSRGRLSTGPMFQLDDTKMLSPKVGLRASRNQLARLGGFENSTIDDNVLISVPLSLDFQWLFHRQWEYSFSYDYSGYESGFRNDHEFGMAIKHFW